VTLNERVVQALLPLLKEVREEGDEDVEERLMRLLDRLEGWCNPRWRIDL